MSKNIQIVDMGSSVSENMLSAVRALGHTSTICLYEDWQKHLIPAQEPELWILCARYLEDTEIAAIAKVIDAKSIPTLVFVEQLETLAMPKIIDAGVSMVVIDDFQEKRLPSLIALAEARHAKNLKLTQELESTKSRLDDRKFIEKAKGFLMKHSELSEDEAYGKLRKVAMNRGVKLVQVAHETIELFESDSTDYRVNS